MEILEKIALSKVGLSDTAYKKVSAELKAGEYSVDMLIRIKGDITKGDDYKQDIVLKADPWGLLAVALSKLNDITVEALTREALKLTKDKMTKIKEQAKEAIIKVKGPTETKCNGKVTAKVVAEIVENNAEAAA